MKYKSSGRNHQGKNYFTPSCSSRDNYECAELNQVKTPQISGGLPGEGSWVNPGAETVIGRVSPRPTLRSDSGVRKDQGSEHWSSAAQPVFASFWFTAPAQDRSASVGGREDPLPTLAGADSLRKRCESESEGLQARQK